LFFCNQFLAAIRDAVSPDILSFDFSIFLFRLSSFNRESSKNTRQAVLPLSEVFYYMAKKSRQRAGKTRVAEL